MRLPPIIAFTKAEKLSDTNHGAHTTATEPRRGYSTQSARRMRKQGGGLKVDGRTLARAFLNA